MLKNQEEKRTWKKGTLITVTCFLLCVAGCGFQLSQIGKVYFSYKTRAELTISLAIKLQLPYFSLCFRFMDLITFSEHENRKEIFQERESNNINGDWYYELWSTLKVRDIFKLTPSIDDLILQCFIRNEKNLWVVNGYSKSKCLKHITSMKYVHRELICYKIDPFITNQTIESLPVANSIEFYNSQFMITLNHSSFEKALFMAAFVHIPGSSEYIDSTQNKLEVLSDDKEKGNFFLWYTTVTLLKLPPPFDTACDKNLLNTTGTELGLECMNRMLKRKFNKLFPFPHLYDYNIDDVLISAQDLARNATIADAVQELRVHCIKSRAKCKLIHTQSHVSIKTGKRGSNLYLYIPITTTFAVVHRPNMILIDLVVYMCSCLGIWIGFSAWKSLKSAFRLSWNASGKGKLLSDSDLHRLILQLESNRIINEELFDAMFKSKHVILHNTRLQNRRKIVPNK